MDDETPMRGERGRVSRWFVLASVVSSSVFFVLLGVLHIVRRDLDPGMHFISEYEVGPSGWLMQLAFFSIATSGITFVIGLFEKLKSVSGVLGMSLLVISASGMLLAAFVPPGSTPGLHDLGATLDMVPLAAILVSLSLGRDARWRRRRWLLWLLGIVPFLGFLAYVVAMASVLPGLTWDPSVGAPVGWQNRLMIVAQAGWLVAIAGWHLSHPRLRAKVGPDLA